MPPRLEAIKLNHDPNAATSDALSIRRNNGTFVTVPEWRRGISVNPADSPAAYSIADTQGHTLTIHARFSCTEHGHKKFEVRAVDDTVDPPAPRGCPRGCLPLWRLLAALIRDLFGNVLGNVKAREVTCSRGQTEWETFELENLRLWNVGVGIHTTTWRWQYRAKSNDPWTDFDTSSHRIYVLLALPTDPWKQIPFDPTNRQLPWTDVLDYACQWALGKTNRDAAATAVTWRLNGLGPALIEYDCPGGGSTHYAWGGFNCTAFLDRLHGGPGNGQYVNCTDCATFTSTFANILGCDLWQSQMGYDFGLNPIRAIGAGAWYPGCPEWLIPGFTYHEVAWKGACLQTDRIFDACLEVDGDVDPTTAPHTPLLPTNMLFGSPGSGDYRDRLATPATRPSCAPQPSTRTRRAIS
jgi:hypothetical protein